MVWYCGSCGDGPHKIADYCPNCGWPRDSSARYEAADHVQSTLNRPAEQDQGSHKGPPASSLHGIYGTLQDNHIANISHTSSELPSFGPAPCCNPRSDGPPMNSAPQPQPTTWFCNYCENGPMSIRLNSYCSYCYKARDSTATLEPAEDLDSDSDREECG